MKVVPALAFEMAWWVADVDGGGGLEEGKDAEHEGEDGDAHPQRAH